MKRNQARMPTVKRETKGKTPHNPDKPLGYANPPKETQIKPGQVLNPKGRPRTISELRELIQELAGEKVGQSDLTRLELMLRAMLVSKSASDKQTVLEYGWGKVPQQVDLNDLRDKKDSEIVDEFSDIIHAARARAGVAPGGGTPAAGADGGESNPASE